MKINKKLLSVFRPIKKFLQEEKDIVGYIEWIDDSYITGWVISRNGLRPRLKCSIDNNDYPVYTKWIERRDVAEQYGSKYINSGFQISLADTTQSFDEFLAGDKPIKVFANDDLLKSIADEQLQMSAAVSRILANDNAIDLNKDTDTQKKILADLLLKAEKIGLTYKSEDISITITSWGHFTLQGTASRVAENKFISLYSDNKLLECAVLWKELVDKPTVDDEDENEDEQQHFEIEIPGYIWEDAKEGVCELDIYFNEEKITETPLTLSKTKVLTWVSDIIKIAESQEKQYRLLLSLEHIRYGLFLNQLTPKEFTIIRKFVSKMQLNDFIFSADSVDQDKFFAIEKEKVQTESVVTLSTWRALRVLNARITNRQSAIFDDVKSVIEDLKLKGKARDRFLFSVTPTLCDTGEFLRLREFSYFSTLKSLAYSEKLWEMSLALPAIMFDKEIDIATDFVYKISAVASKGGWLNTECIRYAVELARQIEAEGEIEIREVEKFRYSVIALLDDFGGDGFTRLHDQKLIDSMVLILTDLNSYTDYHRQDVVTAAQRIYGLNPAFWQTVVKKNILELDSELTRGYLHFKKVYDVLVKNNSSTFELLEAIAEPLAYFRAKNNPEAVIFLREILANHLSHLNDTLPVRGKALIAKLLASDPTEALRVAAFPLAVENQLVERFPETDVNMLRETLRSLSDTDKSVALHLQEQAHVRLDNLLIAHRQGDAQLVEEALFLLERDAVLLNNWQGNFLAFDLLASAYTVADLHHIDGASLLAQMLFVLEKVIRETRSDWFLAAPVLAGLIRLNNFEANNRVVLKNFISECRTLISWKFGERMDGLFEPITQSKLAMSTIGWPQDTLVVIYSCRKYLNTRVKAIRETWLKGLQARGIPYVIMVGDGDDSIENNDILALNVSDRYEDLPKKTLKLFDWVYQYTNAQYVLKIDDDCYLDVERFFDTLSYRKHFYYGRVIERGIGSMDRAWHQSKSDTEHARKSIDKSPEPSVYADGGGAYTLSRLAMLKLLEAEKTVQGNRLMACSFMEDKLVGDLLALSFIKPSNEDYESYQRRRTFPEAMPVAMRENLFFPSQATPTKVVHLDTELDLALTYQREDSRALWPKKIWSTYWSPKIKVDNNQLELLGDPTKASTLLAEQVMLVAVVRNEIIMLPHFLAHYRTLGIRCFIIVDNCSDDGSREYLYQQPDVVLYSCDTAYKYSHYGVTWQQTILGNHCLGKWVILADADELLIFEDCETKSLSDFIAEIEAEGANAAITYMIDMYPENKLEDADFDQQPPFVCASFFDKNPLIKWQLSSGMYSSGATYLSALRHRLIDNSQPNAFTSQKHSLVKYQPWVRFSEGLHDASNLTLSKRATWFAHFKYHAGFKNKINIEIQRGQHFNNAAEYRRYANLLSESQGNFAKKDTSVQYTSSQDFVNTLKFFENE